MHRKSVVGKCALVERDVSDRGHVATISFNFLQLYWFFTFPVNKRIIYHREFVYTKLGVNVCWYILFVVRCVKPQLKIHWSFNWMEFKIDPDYRKIIIRLQIVFHLNELHRDFFNKLTIYVKIIQSYEII
jgi:hypothetical protein